MLRSAYILSMMAWPNSLHFSSLAFSPSCSICEPGGKRVRLECGEGAGSRHGTRLAVEVVGDGARRDRALQTADDQVGGLVPPHVTQLRIEWARQRVRHDCGRARCERAIISPERIMLPGFTLSRPALQAGSQHAAVASRARGRGTHYLGAVPCVASKMAWPVL